jgi:DNA-directed RNA polymerase subunit RPC12/RpoP
MTLVRQFRCAACGHEFAVPYGTGRRGREMTCPACGQASVHRVDTGGRGRSARGTWPPAGAGRGSGRRN